MQTTLFTKIINGDIPSHKVYEDEKTYAFMDIHPVNEGHVLVVPKNPVEFIWDLPHDDYHALMQTVQKVGVRLREVLSVPYVGAQVVGTDVPHAHVHVIPFSHASELKKDVDTELEPDHDALAILAEKLRF